MTDPLSITAGVVGLLGFGIQVTDSLVTFYSSYKGQGVEVARMAEKLESLSDTFRYLDTALRNRTFRPDEEGLIKSVESSISNCDEVIQELKEECDKLQKVPNNGIKAIVTAAGRRVAYPFRESTLKKLHENIDDICHNISLALEVLQLRDNETVQDDITEVKLLIESVRATQVSWTIRDWLKAPDATINHNAACAKRYPGTGSWFVKGSTFATWLTKDSSFLWVNGFAGSGKSVLCSTAIQYSARQKRTDPGIGLAFFYFTFNDDSKRDESAMVRDLLLQLSGQRSDSQTDLARLHDSYSMGLPPTAVLMAYLRQLIQKFDQVYILVDALDESPRYDQRDQVLDTIQTMREWHLPGLHLLVTSRDEPDIRESLSPTKNEEVVMKNDEINQDIADFISGQLETNPKLRKWRAFRDRIQQALTQKAHGLFRWVECQFKAIERCHRSESHLDQCLLSLPRGLDETYERILCSIDENSIQDARRILTLLCYSSRPLTVQETIDGIAVDLHEPACLDRRRRLQDLDDLLGICPGLVDVNVEEGKKVSIDCEETDNTPEETHTLRIAHFSVQEYLESDRIRHQKAANFALQYTSAHAEITQICLVYLLEPGLSTGRLDRAKLEEYPLTCFAANFWPHHYKNASDAATHLDDLIMGIFQPQQPALLTWVRITNPDLPYRTQIISALSQTDIASPIYYASFLGLSWVAHKLINNCQGHTDADVNTEGGRYGYPLHAASLKGHDKVVEILLEAGASINARGGLLGYPLVAAAVGGYDKVVKVLIKAGAELDVVNEEYDYKMRDGAFEGGRDNFIEMLVSAALDDNTQAARYSTALQAASHGGHVEVVKTLIAAGANINIQGGRFGNALQSAAHGGHNEVVLILIATGADIKAQGGFYGHALQAASNQGHRDVVLTLIAAGADINAQGGRFGTALQAAAHGRCNAVVKLLIAAGADINAQCGKFGSALGAAVHEDYDEVVETLRAAGADDGVKA